MASSGTVRSSISCGRSPAKVAQSRCERLNDASVSRIVKTRSRALAIARDKSKAEARKLVAAYSSHSMRAGYATTACEYDEPGYRIQQRMRHKSADTTTGYIRAGEQWTKSGLKGFGF